MRILKFAAAVAAALSLAACASKPVTVAAPPTTRSAEVAQAAAAAPGAPQSVQSAVALFTVNDLNAALADAKANNDVVSANCYTALIPIVQARGTATGLPIKGGFSAFQKLRDLDLAARSGLPQGLNIACAPLVLDVQNTMIRLGAIAAGTAATGGVITPALPLLGPALPIPLP